MTKGAFGPANTGGANRRSRRSPIYLTDMEVEPVDPRMAACLCLLGLELCPVHKKHPHPEREPIPPAHHVRDGHVTMVSTMMSVPPTDWQVMSPYWIDEPKCTQPTTMTVEPLWWEGKK